MQLLAAGLNHHTAPLALRERIAVSGERLDAALARLGGRVGTGFVLSTCNRTECYALVGHAATGADVLAELLCEGSDVTPAELQPHMDVHAHEEAVAHLFRVAAGVDSMVPGEDQIVAQLKWALERADAAGTLDTTMHRLGASALAAGKRVRAETGLSRHALSVVSVALQLATERLGTIAGRRVLVVGAGSTAELALRHLAGAHAQTLTLVNRTADRGAALAARFGARTAPWDGLHEALANADLVLTSTSAPGAVIGRSAVERAVASRDGTPLVIFDLAVPRDVEASSGAVGGVSLWDIDGLQAICDDNRRRRTAEIARAEAIVDSEAERFMAWWSARQLAPTITALLAQADAIREREVLRALARMPELDEHDVEQVRTLATRVVAKLLHRPLTVLKTDPEGANMAQVVQQLFGLEADPESAAQRPERATAAPDPAGPACPHPAR